MNIGEFVNLFDAKAVAEGKIAFTFHAPKSGKWNFWSDADKPTTRAALAGKVMKIKELAEQEITGFEEVSLEPWDEDGLRVRVTF